MGKNKSRKRNINSTQPAVDFRPTEPFVINEDEPESQVPPAHGAIATAAERQPVSISRRTSLVMEHDDEFMFRRLGRKLRLHWDKLEKYLAEKNPSASFFAHHRPENASTATLATESGKQEVSPVTPPPRAPQQSSGKLFSSSWKFFPRRKNAGKDATSTFLERDLVAALFSIPQYSLMVDEEGRHGVPFMGLLLKVSVSRESTEEASEDFNLFNPNPLFSIYCEYGFPGSSHFMRWTIHRKLVDIFKLHSILVLREIQEILSGGIKVPPFPNQFMYLLDASLLATWRREFRAEEQPKLLEDRRKAIERYLQDLLHVVSMHLTPEVCEFFEFSAMSPDSASEPDCRKLKEGYLKNRVFDMSSSKGWFSCLFSWIPSFRVYQTKWFILRPSYLMFLDHVDQRYPSDILLVDQHFRVEIENNRSRNILKPFRILIRNGSKLLEVRPESNSQTQYWLEQLEELSLKCVWSRTHRFGSFAPIRSNASIEWLIDGHNYFTKVTEALLSAREEIFIHGWWVSPELHLKRPASKHPELRLDQLLKKKAEEGVKIYVIVFKELSLALNINSYHTKVTLEALHPNIVVQRHPDHLAGGVLYWSRHEKTVVVDQRIAFMGGLDLAFGRYDCCNHRLSDLGAENGAERHHIWTGMDYSNPRIRDFRNVSNHDNCLVDRNTVPRMPWHDVHCVLYGQAARDLGRHFIQSWNYVKAEKASASIPFLIPRADFPADSDMKGTCQVQILRSCADWSLGCSVERSIYSAYISLIESAEHFIYIENQFLISNSSLDDRPTGNPVKNRIGAAIVRRILRAHSEGHKFRVIVVMPLMPAFEAAVDQPEASSTRLLLQSQYASISKGSTSIIGQLQQNGIQDTDEYISFFSLRRHDQLNGNHITEQIYVHTKVAIFDDKYAIIGSANINDRSMLGMRDSELALVVSDKATVPVPLCTGEVLKAGRSIQKLRLDLWREHLDVSEEELSVLLDPLDDRLYHDLLRLTASRNTQIYRELFHCLPDDYVETWSEYAMFIEKPQITTIDSETWKGIDVMDNLKLIRGNLVLFPTKFLRKEELSANVLSAQYLLPIEIYL